MIWEVGGEFRRLPASIETPVKRGRHLLMLSCDEGKCYDVRRNYCMNQNEEHWELGTWF